MPRRVVVLALVALVVVAASLSLSIAAASSFRLHLVSSDDANESMVLRAKLQGEDVFFLVDTGYAGSPVLSTTYLALDDAAKRRARARASRDVAEAYAATVAALHAVRGDEERALAVQAYLQTSSCYAYQSGCTMRLLSVGSVSETQSDMLLCDALRFQTASGAAYYAAPRRFGSSRGSGSGSSGGGRGDVLITNPLPSSVHILTMDYLFTVAPCLLQPGRGQMQTSVRTRPSRFRYEPLRLVGGAPVVDVRIGDAVFACTLDTGAPGGVSLGASAAARLPPLTCTHTSLTQHGVNADSICSTVYAADVTVLGITLHDAIVLVNDAEVQHTDGYIGMACLRALDLYVSHAEVGAAPSGLAPQSASSLPTSRGACAATAAKVACA